MKSTRPNLRNLAVIVIAAAVLSVGLMPIGSTRAAEPAAAKQRTFLFTYAATIGGLKPGQVARVWLPVAQDTPDQKVEIVEQALPAGAQVGREAKWGNRILYFESPAGADGSIPLRIVYRVTRREATETPSLAGTDAPDSQYLAADTLVPIGGKPLSLLAGKILPTDQYQLGRLLYDVVDDHMQYRKDKPGFGRGDAVWACDNGFGNCTDFHSLFISLARSNKLPARFEIGFPIPEPRGGDKTAGSEKAVDAEVAGYHCWAWFKPAGHGWVPVDISEANKNPSKRDYFFDHLDEHRVTFTTGRDLELVPKQSGPPVNFLIYPYVEADGKPLPPENVKKQFRYSDIDAPR